MHNRRMMSDRKRYLDWLFPMTGVRVKKKTMIDFTKKQMSKINADEI